MCASYDSMLGAPDLSAAGIFMCSGVTSDDTLDHTNGLKTTGKRANLQRELSHAEDYENCRITATAVSPQN